MAKFPAGAPLWLSRALNRAHARLAARTRPAGGFVSQPEPRTIGSFARGRQLIAGNFLFAGVLVEDKTHPIWEIEIPDPLFEEEMHGFAWLDDLAAVGDRAARQKAQEWLMGWIARYGRGHGPGWSPDLTGRRLIRWINHAIFLLNGQPPEASRAYHKSLAHQTVFLSRRFRAAAPGLPRFEAITGLIYAGLALNGMERVVRPAVRALARECSRRIDEEGGLPTRNPEELLEVFTLLNWAAGALRDTGQQPGEAHAAAIARIAPALRALRHADGALARFHGGGRGAEGRLDTALAASGIKAPPREGLSMGFARLHGGRSTLIMDAAPPPSGLAAWNAHASTLAFELTSGRRPLIVNCGSGISFGRDWRRAGRASASHSTLALDGVSSARLGKPVLISGHERELLVDGPRDVRVRFLRNTDEPGGAVSIVAGHDGYLKSHGLTHIRRVELAANGRSLSGEDSLATLGPEDERRFDAMLDRTRLSGIGFRIHFHLHPDVDAELDMGGAAVSMALKSGEIWIFRHDGHARLSLEPSVYLERGRLKPRATKQVVLSSRALEYATRIRWTISKAQFTPDAVRDLNRDDVPA